MISKEERDQLKHMHTRFVESTATSSGQREDSRAILDLLADIDKLKGLFLLVDPAVSMEEMNSISAKQFDAYERWCQTLSASDPKGDV